MTQGRATFELDGERQEAGAGTFVFVPPGVKRTAFAKEPATTIVAVGAVPGKAFEPHGYDVWAPLKELYDAGDYAGVADQGREAIEAAQYPDAMYNLACCESLAGRKDDALRHLGRSIELSERFRSFARNDSDFEALRDEPAFKELVGA